MIKSKSHLARELSRVKGFVAPKLSLRQYVTPPSIAAELLWTAFMNNDIESKIVFDLGSGTGMLSIGASLLGGKVTGFELDGEAIKTAIKNAQELGARVIFFEEDVDAVTGEPDTIFMNPPFMVKDGKNDRVFLEKAFSLCDRVYSIHNSATNKWIRDFAKSHGFTPELISTREFKLPKQYVHHERLKSSQEVSLWFFHKP